MKLQEKDQRSSRFDQVYITNRIRVSNWQNRASTVNVITSFETRTETSGQQSGIDSGIIVPGAPSTPTRPWHPLCHPIRAVHKPHSVRSELAQYVLVEDTGCSTVLWTWRARDMRYHTSKILSFVKHQRWQTSHEEGLLSMTNIAAILIPHTKATIRLTHQQNRGEDNITLVVNVNTDKWGFIGVCLTKQTSPDTRGPEDSCTFAQYTLRRSLRQEMRFSSHVTNSGTTLETYVEPACSSWTLLQRAAPKQLLPPWYRRRS